MSQSIIGEGTKIAQAAKDLNVTSVTIRRYLTEFNVPTTSDESGIMVLPPASVAELSLIRKLKEDGLGNQEILDTLTGSRGGVVAPPVSSNNGSEIATATDADAVAPQAEIAEHDTEADELGAGGSTRPRHALTCQTCGKSFEHTNPRLRDCLDCYRSKRKERRRGAPRVVIQHPLAKQAASKTRGESGAAAEASSNGDAAAEAPEDNGGQNGSATTYGAARSPLRSARNYRKAIDETRHITSNLKRRLDRADLPEGERKWLEQIYAYQLILHQGWRHLLEYRSASSHQPQEASAETPATG